MALLLDVRRYFPDRQPDRIAQCRGRRYASCAATSTTFPTCVDSRVVTVAGTTSAQFLNNAGIGYTDVTLIEEAYELLRTEQVDAVVYDAPVLLNYIQNEGDDEFRTAGQPFGTDQYGIVLPEGSPYYETINHAILQLQEDGTYQHIYERWFGTN